MMQALLGAAVGAVIGALAAYVFDIRRMARERRQALKDQEAERRRLRKTIATALLTDLRVLETLLLQLYHHEQAGDWKGQPPRFYYDHMRADVASLTPDTVMAITEVFGLAHDLFGLLGESHRVPANERARFHHQIRADAGFTLQAYPPAKQALLKEGGITPEPRALEIVYPPNLPVIPERSFPDVSATPGEELPKEFK